MKYGVKYWWVNTAFNDYREYKIGGFDNLIDAIHYAINERGNKDKYTSSIQIFTYEKRLG